ncbi:SDR family NAD(P)-dependent oxidoreductase [Dactylosporangium matsuzakiense]|uniref:Short-chain dehydrogenase n=1 Tax=Dactylosporangium matsuzakiense TaxID=53360 RepID=A0A9W6KF31_9ACTN|nr:SDR family NAD(P)-dependent oxidoreductase [Dactylosporangium matsuzakiense]UWZ45634.1 SDR family NAD(P)-dependent oxidoreductase [Dactylosporangium matsuzakiense]GLL00353.1 short-chain dehydrogenase [Dactylosporangium matsuzakiense]
MGDLTGRTVVVTGASSGIGLAAAIGMARRGANTVLVGRNPARLEAAVSAVSGAANGRPVPAYRSDFAKLEDVHVLVDHLRQRYQRIDVLANNAGGMIRGHHVTADGFEATLQTNHLAAFLLSSLLREQLRGGRIISTASGAHAMGVLDPADLRGARRRGAWRMYGSAKQANILFAAEAARRWPDIMSASYHPGFVRSRFGASVGVHVAAKLAPFARSPEKGAETLVWLAATPPSQLTSGGYYMDRRLIRPNRVTDDPALAGRLWEASLEAVGLG